MLRGEETKSAVTGVDVKVTPTTTAVGGGPVAATTATGSGQLAPIQQQPSGQPRRVRDELDPAPHHTAADIRVLEILKRIRDSGSVGDDNFDIPPPKRKPGRTRVERPTFTRQAPAPVLPQPQATTTTTSATTTISLDSFKVPLSSRLDSIRPRTSTSATIPSQLKNGTPTPPPAIVLATTNGTAVPVTTGLVATAAAGGSVTAPTAVAVIQQKQVTTTTGSRTPQQAPQSIGLELILPNGLRIPVSATCAKPDAPIQPTTTGITVASTGGVQVTAALNKLSSTALPTAVARTPASTTTSTSQQICSCSRSKCLKLYCECFAAGRACGDSCNCRHCYNNLADDISKQTRDVAMRTALSRNPLAFKPKIEISGKHVLGCRCKRSHCLKGYCECYLAKIPCNQRCRCLGCSNEETATTNTNTTATTTTTTSTTSVNDVANATSTTAAGAESFKETQVSWLASLATRQQVAAAAAAAAAGSTTTPIGVVATAATTTTTSVTATTTTTPSIAATVTAVTATPRTITLNVPIKALTAASETGRVIAHPAGSSTDLPPLLLHQSYLAAAAAAAVVAAAGGGNTTQQDLIKCLNTVLPAVRSQPQLQSQTPHFIIPGVVQATVSAGRPTDASTAETTTSATVAAPVSKLSPPFSIVTKTERVEEDEVNNGTTASASEASPGRLNDDSSDDDDDGKNNIDIGNGEDVAEEDNYSGYTEEELAFMHRLQQNRNTTAAPATGFSQVMKKEDFTVGDDVTVAAAGAATRESPQSLASSRDETEEPPPPLPESLFSSSSPSSSYCSDAADPSVTGILSGVPLVTQQSHLQAPQPGTTTALGRTVQIVSEDRLPVLSHSAPPSLGPDSEERLLSVRCSVLEARFLRRKIDELETQVSRLTQLIRTQGEMLSNLTEMMQRQQQQQQQVQTQHQQ